MKYILLIAFFLGGLAIFAWADESRRVRKLYLKRDDIATVHTAVGIATLIQVPDRPTSVVIGDTNAFKVEYLESAITIKPLGHSVKSNLYIYTEGRRYSVSLVTAPQTSADYIVYLEPEVKPIEKPKERWRTFILSRISKELGIHVTRLGVAGDLLLAELSIGAKKDLVFKPEWVWLTQNGKTVPIQSLNLSDLKISGGQPFQLIVSFKRVDVQGVGHPLIEIRASEKITLKLPEVKSWMR